MRILSLALLLLVVPAASCAVDGRYPGASLDAVQAEAGFDDFGPGLTATADPSANPLAGAFFNDGKNGDVRARTDYYFVDSNDDGLPDVRVPATSTPKQERMLVYKGQLAIEVARAEDAAKAFLAKIEAWGGYLQSQSGTNLTVRLPAQHFDDAFAAAKGGGRVLREQRQANDVTEEFVDLGIRLDTARKSRDRLLEVLQKADKVEDILAVEKELRRLTEEIERMEGRLKFLRDQVAMATLDLEFRSIAEAPPPPPKRRQPSRFSWINQVGAQNVMERF